MCLIPIAKMVFITCSGKSLRMFASIIKPIVSLFRFGQSLQGRLVLFLAVPLQSLKPIGVLLGSLTEKYPLIT